MAGKEYTDEQIYKAQAADCDRAHAEAQRLANEHGRPAIVVENKYMKVGDLMAGKPMYRAYMPLGINDCTIANSMLVAPNNLTAETIEAMKREYEAVWRSKFACDRNRAAHFI